MRHSFATSYLHAGGNIEDLSRILGHSDINTTYRRYVRPSVDDLAISMSSVVRIFPPSVNGWREGPFSLRFYPLIIR